MDQVGQLAMVSLQTLQLFVGLPALVLDREVVLVPVLEGEVVTSLAPPPTLVLDGEVVLVQISEEAVDINLPLALVLGKEVAPILVLEEVADSTTTPNTGFGGGSPSPNTRRSSGYQINSSSASHGSGRGCGRGGGFHDNFTAQERPELHYNKSMLEDPWRWLIPVVKKLTAEDENSSTPGSWLPKSISGKKDKTSEAVAGIKSSGSSLAAALAASYEEASAANDAKDVSDGL